MSPNTWLWRDVLDATLLVTAAALSIGAVLMLLGLNREVATSQSLLSDSPSSFSVRAEFELATLISELNEFIQEESSLDNVQTRYEILVARATHYETTYLAKLSEIGSDTLKSIEDFKDRLLELDDPFYDLQPGDREKAKIIREQLKLMRSPLAELSNLVKNQQVNQYQKIDDSLARSVRIGTLFLACSLILSALTIARFWYNLRSKTRFNRDLKTRIQARTSDLQSSNNELKKQIAERRRTEKKLAEREHEIHRVQKMEAIGKITAGVAHDFNNLLAVIMGNIELAINGNHDQKSMKFLDNAFSASVKGSQLTRKLLAFGRRAPLKPETVNLNEVVSELDDLFVHTISEINKLKYVLADDIKPILVDRSLLENVLLNLIINARDALPDGGVIEIVSENVIVESDQRTGSKRALPVGDCVQISVVDVGSGMTSDVLDQAMEPFFSTKPESEGSGLGLSMAYGFVQQSHGDMRVVSKPGVGTSVTMVFPACADNDNTMVAPSPIVRAPEPVHRTRKILVAEDSSGVRDMVVAQLQQLGFETIEAANGQDAYRIIQANESIDLLLTDVVMPGSLQGPVLAEKALLVNPDLRIIFMSGYPKGIDQTVEGPTSQFTKLMKPVALSALAEALNNEFETAPIS